MKQLGEGAYLRHQRDSVPRTRIWEILKNAWHPRPQPDFSTQSSLPAQEPLQVERPTSPSIDNLDNEIQLFGFRCCACMRSVGKGEISGYLWDVGGLGCRLPACIGREKQEERP
jgi:hypothetical protein